MKSELCKTCIHTAVCGKDKNTVGDIFIPGHPAFFDNEELFRQYKEREAAGFPCDQYELARTWVPVSESTPAEGIRVLVQLANSWIIAACYEDGKWWSVPEWDNFGGPIYEDDDLYKVEAWMPLPGKYGGDTV